MTPGGHDIIVPVPWSRMRFIGLLVRLARIWPDGVYESADGKSSLLLDDAGAWAPAAREFFVYRSPGLKAAWDAYGAPSDPDDEMMQGWTPRGPRPTWPAARPPQADESMLHFLWGDDSLTIVAGSACCDAVAQIRKALAR